MVSLTLVFGRGCHTNRFGTRPEGKALTLTCGAGARAPLATGGPRIRGAPRAGGTGGPRLGGAGGPRTGGAGGPRPGGAGGRPCPPSEVTGGGGGGRKPLPAGGGLGGPLVGGAGGGPLVLVT